MHSLTFFFRSISLLLCCFLPFPISPSPSPPPLPRQVCTGRVYSGRVRTGDTLYPLTREGAKGEPMKVMKVFCRRGTTREELDAACAGDIVSVAGIVRFMFPILEKEKLIFHLCIGFE